MEGCLQIVRYARSILRTACCLTFTRLGVRLDAFGGELQRFVFRQRLAREIAQLGGESGREQNSLPACPWCRTSVEHRENSLDILLKAQVQQAIGLVENELSTPAEDPCLRRAHVIDHAARRAHHDTHSLAQACLLRFPPLATHQHATDNPRERLAQLVHHFVRLETELASGEQDEHERAGRPRHRLCAHSHERLHGRKCVRQCLARACGRANEHVSPVKDARDGQLLHWGQPVELHLADLRVQILVQRELGERARGERVLMALRVERKRGRQRLGLRGVELLHFTSGGTSWRGRVASAFWRTFRLI
mmetsp:Transcript_2666/g.5548  ORF Transcript_2666/g.5548 Transcript_2666/m.5548 type:complete len:307 (+) Transcript_2666:1474-2394(+)